MKILKFRQGSRTGFGVLALPDVVKVLAGSPFEGESKPTGEELALADLAALGINPSTIIPGPSTRAFAARMSEVGALAPTSLLGALYVIEGSSNGGVFIAKAVERALHLAPGTATRAINPHAGSTRDNWGQFKTTIDSLPFG